MRVVQLHPISSKEFCHSFYALQVILDTCCTLKLSDFSLACSSKNPPDSSSERFLSDSRTWFQTKERPRPKTEPLTMKKGQQQQQRCDDVSPLDCSSSNHLYSPFYAAPELFAGSAFSVATDMWSLGCVVFEMLVGRRPFCADSLEALQEMVRGDFGEELGAWSKLVCSLLEKLPDQRYVSCPFFGGSFIGRFRCILLLNYDYPNQQGSSLYSLDWTGL